MIFKKINCSNTTLLYFSASEETNETQNISYWFDLSDNIIHFKCVNETENQTYIDLQIPFSTIKQSSLFADQTIWTVSDDSVYKTGTLNASDLVAPLALSLATKNNSLITQSYSTTSCPFRIFVPGKNSSLEECVFMVKVPNVTEEDTNPVIVSIDGPSYNNESLQSMSSWKELFETPSLDSTVTGSNIKVDVSVSNSDITEVFLEPVVGSIDRTRVPLVNGAGSFNISTSSLTAGDQVRVKLGYKYFTGVTEFTATV